MATFLEHVTVILGAIISTNMIRSRIVQNYVSFWIEASSLHILLTHVVFILSSPSSSYICHGVATLVDPFRSHVSRSLFKGLPRFLLPVGQ